MHRSICAALRDQILTIPVFDPDMDNEVIIALRDLFSPYVLTSCQFPPFVV
jgi:hypothetical protein